MSGLLILRGLLFATECFLASLLLPMLAFAAAALLRHHAALRHLVFATMFGVLAVLPLVALLLPPRRIVEHVAAPVAIAAPVDVAPMLTPAVAPPPSLFTPENIVLLLVALWLAGICWQGLRLGLGGLGLMRLRRASVPFATDVQTGCAVRLAAGEHGPSTFGIIRPVVLLPRAALAWPAARLDAVLRHEAAHVARRDTATQFIARLVCAVFWPNPLLWLAARSLRRAAEIAADDAVLAGGMTPSLYAAELVSLAAESRGVSPGIAMAGPPLAQRVEAVLANNFSRKGVTRMDMARTVTLGLTAALLLGVARFDIAVAQDVVPAAPVMPKVEKNFDIQIEKNVAVQAKAEARTAEVKAKADAVVAKAKAKAAAETDPAKKAQYEQDAVQVAADAARIKADADRIGVDMRQRAAEVAERVSADKARADDMRQRAQILAERARADAERRGVTLAQMVPQARTQTEASSSADAESSTSVNGVTRTTRSGNRNGAPQNSNSNSNSDTITNNGPSTGRARVDDTRRQVTLTAPRADEMRRRAEELAARANRDGMAFNFTASNRPDFSNRFDSGTVHIDARIDAAIAAAADRPETRQAIATALRDALAEAGRKIDAAIAEAKAKAGLPPTAPMAMPPVPPIPRVPAIPPVPSTPG